MASDGVRAVSVVVRGRVQGVFFRDTCRSVAAEAGVTGWVRNLDDGTLEAHLEGPADAVDSVLAWMRDGPPQADVQAVEVDEVAPAGMTGFSVR